MATERTAWLLAALLVAACGGGEAPVEESPAVDADGNPVVAPAPAPQVRPPTPVLAEADTVILREVFSYAGGPRDPFVSLLNVTTSGPELADLELTSIYYVNASPSQSVAVLRERVSGRRHSVRPGQRLGRLYVAEISPQDVWFTIDDFGVTRRESLTLRKQEEGIR